MRVTRNEKLIKRRARFGTYATLAGLAVLVGGMIASFERQGRYLWISLIALLAGFLLSQYGSYSLRRWGRSPRPDEVVETSLKGFDDRYHLYTWEWPVPYLLLSPQGLYTFTTRDQTGSISVRGEQWHAKFSLGRALMLFAQEGLGNPSKEAAAQAAQVNKLVQTELPEVQVNTQPVIVFLNERAQLHVEDPVVPVLEAKDLKKWLRGAGKGANMKTTDYRAIEKLFDGRSSQTASQ